jgi:hypothetical protein
MGEALCYHGRLFASHLAFMTSYCISSVCYYGGSLDERLLKTLALELS